MTLTVVPAAALPPVLPSAAPPPPLLATVPPWETLKVPLVVKTALTPEVVPPLPVPPPPPAAAINVCWACVLKAAVPA